METQIKETLSEYLLALGDDELILGHRDSEWCGHAPLLEEDIAFANLALDEIGHATIWYTLLADLLDEDREQFPDQLVYRRSPEEFRNAQLLELPNGDWAFSLLRQYLFDLYELHNLAGLQESRFRPLAEAAQKISKEELYHYRHTSAWVRRLCLGTQESHRRMQAALDQTWSLAKQFFTHPPESSHLADSNYIPSREPLLAAWHKQATQFLLECQLSVPTNGDEPAPRHLHTPALKVLIGELQSVARLEPEGVW